MSEETVVKVEGEITETELKEALQYIALRSVRMRRGKGWSPVEAIALKLFHDEIQEFFKQNVDVES